MTDRETVQKKLEHLSKYTDFLNSMRKYSEKEFVADMMINGSVERYFQLSIEVLVDLGNHIIADENYGSVEWNRDVPEIFHSQGFINPELKAKWINMIQFRNLLVHEYAVIDKKRVFEILRDHLEELVDLQKMFAEKFL